MYSTIVHMYTHTHTHVHTALMCGCNPCHHIFCTWYGSLLHVVHIMVPAVAEATPHVYHRYVITCKGHLFVLLFPRPVLFRVLFCCHKDKLCTGFTHPLLGVCVSAFFPSRLVTASSHLVCPSFSKTKKKGVEGSCMGANPPPPPPVPSFPSPPLHTGIQKVGYSSWCSSLHGLHGAFALLVCC